MRSISAIPRTLLTLLSGALATAFLGSAVIVVSWFRPESRTIERLIRAWALAWLAPAGCKLTVEGLENVDPSRSYVVIANHLSNLDVMVCFRALPIPIRYLAKKELFSVPLLNSAMRSVGIVEVDRQARGAAIDSVNFQAARVIAHGHSLIIYPEGTRSRSGTLRPFKKGAFTMAAAAEMPILPMTIHGTWEMWRPGGRTIRPGRVHVVIDQAIPTVGFNKSDVEALRLEAHRLVTERLRQMPSETLAE